MAKDKPQPQQTMEDYLMAQLQEEVTIDGHVMTKQEAIATTIINKALNGDVKAATYIQNLQLRSQRNKKQKQK